MVSIHGIIYQFIPLIIVIYSYLITNATAQNTASFNNTDITTKNAFYLASISLDVSYIPDYIYFDTGTPYRPPALWSVYHFNLIAQRILLNEHYEAIYGPINLYIPGTTAAFGIVNGRQKVQVFFYTTATKWAMVKNYNLPQYKQMILEITQQAVNDAETIYGSQHHVVVSDISMAASPVPATCFDKMQNGEEVGIDCGGPVCSPCPLLSACIVDRDCGIGQLACSKDRSNSLFGYCVVTSSTMTHNISLITILVVVVAMFINFYIDL